MTALSKEVIIPCSTWYEGHVTSSEAALVGEVVKVDSHVEQSPSQVLPKESCLIRVDEIIGSSPELQGATTAKLVANHIHDTYQQLEPDWGLYRHLRAGQKVLVLIHRYENDVAVGSDALLVLTEANRALPESLQRTHFDPVKFTDADLALWKAASPRQHEHLMGMVTYAREQQALGDVTTLEWLALAGVGLTLGLVVVWIVRKTVHPGN
uniref:hypothetical protein n=1 Tax=Prosthecobacter sp. TaxID=1965333 RepID=UPI0037838290